MILCQPCQPWRFLISSPQTKYFLYPLPLKCSQHTAIRVKATRMTPNQPPHTPSLNTTQRPIFQLTLIHFYGKPKVIRKRVQTLKAIQFWHFMLTLENWMCCLFMVSVLNICVQQVFHLGHQNKLIHVFCLFFFFTSLHL